MNGKVTVEMKLMPVAASFHYILNEKREVVAEPDLLTWAEWFETAERHVALTAIRKIPGKRVYYCSTVFLGIDHGFHFSPYKDEYQPILFETMFYYTDQNGSRGWLDFQVRYRHYAEAEWGHWDAVKRFQTGRLYD